MPAVFERRNLYDGHSIRYRLDTFSVKHLTPKNLQTAALVTGWGLALGAGFLLWQNSTSPETNTGISPSNSSSPSLSSPSDNFYVAPGFEALGKMLGEIQSTEGFQASLAAFCLLDSSGSAVLKHNADRSVVPASTLKTLTTSTALERLAPTFDSRHCFKAPLPWWTASPSTQATS